MISILIIILLSTLLYKDAFLAYFFQDDWFNLKISTIHHLNDFFFFFLPRQDVTFYKPLGMQIPFYILKTLFGLSPVPFHVLALITHATNIILVYFITYKIFQKKNISLFISFLYGTSAIYYTQFFWPSAFSFLIGPTTFFLSFLFFLNFIYPSYSGLQLDRAQKRIRRKIFYYLSIFAFTAGIFTNEMVHILSLVIVYYLFIFKLNKLLKYITPFFILSFAYFFGRFLFFPPPLKDAYQIGIGKHILNNFEGYILWSLNMPEEIKAQLSSFWRLNSQFIHDFPQSAILIYISLFISFCCFILLPLFNIRKSTLKDKRSILLGIGWFTLGLLPVIFFSKHSFSYFLAIPAAGFYLTLGTLFMMSLSKIKKIFACGLLIVIILNWLITSYSTIDFNKNVHWAPRRAKISQELVARIQKNYPQLLQKDIIYIPNSSENKLSLNNQDAFQVIFGDYVTTVYGSPHK